jgi:hypothetical protein
VADRLTGCVVVKVVGGGLWRSTDQGATWSTPSRLTFNSGESYRPAVVIDLGAVIHIVWMDNSPGNNEIYYRKGQVE